MIATKQDLETRLDWIESELEELRDRISELLIERNKVADQLDDLIDQEGKTK